MLWNIFETLWHSLQFAYSMLSYYFLLNNSSVFFFFLSSTFMEWHFCTSFPSEDSQMTNFCRWDKCRNLWMVLSGGPLKKTYRDTWPLAYWLRLELPKPSCKHGALYYSLEMIEQNIKMKPDSWLCQGAILAALHWFTLKPIFTWEK